MTSRALRELRAKGVTTVVNLRMPEEMSRVKFDEAALVLQRRGGCRSDERWIESPLYDRLAMRPAIL